jgi:hypothetical protein
LRLAAVEIRSSDNIALEKHYRVKDLAALWGFCDSTIVKLFANEDGVIRLESNSGRRGYVTLSIPESVVLRVHGRISRKPDQVKPPRIGYPLRTIRLQDFGAGAARKSRKPPR